MKTRLREHLRGMSTETLSLPERGQGEPIIILVRPQMGENIGAAARAMLNCGLTQLRLVAPRDGWPNEKAIANSAGAQDVIEQALVFHTVAEAVADLQIVYATTGRPHDINLPVETVEEAAPFLEAARCENMRIGILFGPERTGLEGDDIKYANRLMTIPLNPTFKSLNLAQAVLLVSYLLTHQQRLQLIAQTNVPKVRPLATKEALDGLMGHLEDALDQSGFFTSQEKKPSMLKNLRAAFTRMDLSEQDVQTFRGVVKALTAHR